MTSIPQHPFGLVLYGDYLYWTDWLLHAVVRVHKYDSNDYTYLEKNLNRQPMGITVFAEDANDCECQLLQSQCLVMALHEHPCFVISRKVRPYLCILLNRYSESLSECWMLSEVPG